MEMPPWRPAVRWRVASSASDQISRSRASQPEASSPPLRPRGTISPKLTRVSAHQHPPAIQIGSGRPARIDGELGRKRFAHDAAHAGDANLQRFHILRRIPAAFVRNCGPGKTRTISRASGIRPAPIKIGLEGVSVRDLTDEQRRKNGADAGARSAHSADRADGRVR